MRSKSLEVVLCLVSSLPCLVNGNFICCCTSAQMPGIKPRGDKNVFRRQVFMVRIHEVSRIKASLKGH